MSVCRADYRDDRSSLLLQPFPIRHLTNSNFDLNTRDGIFECFVNCCDLLFLSVCIVTSRWNANRLNELTTANLFRINDYTDARQNQLHIRFRKETEQKWHFIKVYMFGGLNGSLIISYRRSLFRYCFPRQNRIRKYFPGQTVVPRGWITV